MKFGYFFALMLLLFLSGCVFAGDVNTTDIKCSSDVISVESAVYNSTMEDEVLKDTAGVDIYFDAVNGNNCGDGSLNSPYKSLNSRNIKDNSVIHLAKGNYNLGSLTFNNVKILGEDKVNTVISSNKQSNYYGESYILCLNFKGNSYIEGLTLKNVNCSGASLTIRDTVVTSLLPQGNISIKNSNFINSILKQESIDENTFVSDNLGYAGVAVSLAHGAYDFEASYNGYNVLNKVVVNTHFPSKSKVTVKKSSINRKGYLKFKYSIGKYFSGKKVTLKFAGKVYKVKVAKNGHVTFRVSKKIVGKLKVGKKYKYTLIYKLDKKSRSIKVTKTKLIFTS